MNGSMWCIFSLYAHWYINHILLPKPHLYPRLPHLPPFPTIENEHLLINQTLYENRPTITGIAAILYHHFHALHESNRNISKQLTSTPKSGGIKKREEEATIVRDAYFHLVEENLRMFENVYRGRSIFTVRDDDSVFISVASYREHLLGETLMSAFGQAARWVYILTILKVVAYLFVYIVPVCILPCLSNVKNGTILKNQTTIQYTINE